MYLYTSRTPCGDASMSNEFWTGAKPFDSEEYKTQGVTRMKPGRSDLPDSSRSISMSCSDKILKWNHVGLQGCLVGNIVGQISLTLIVVASNSKEESAIRRGLIGRISSEV